MPGRDCAWRLRGAMTKWGMEAQTSKLRGGQRRPWFRLAAWLVLLITTASPVIAFAQIFVTPSENRQGETASQPSSNSTGQSSENDSDSDQQPTFKTEIEVVTVPVTVTDSSGEFVTDLNPGEIRILDNGAFQRVENFELSSRSEERRVGKECRSRWSP